MTTYKQELSRELTLRQNILITLSAVTPASSVFIILPSILAGLGGASVSAMVLAGIGALFVGMCYAELSSRYPIAGGEYTWTARILNKPLGFGVMLLTLVSGILIIAVIALGTGEYLGVAISSLSGKWVGLLVIVITTAVAALRIKTNAWVTAVFLAIEVLSILVLTVLGVIHISRPVSIFWTPQTVSGTAGITAVSWGAVISALSVALFAYNGYGQAVYYAEETKGASNKIGKAIMVSLLITVVVEIAPLMAVVLGTSSIKKLISDPSPMSFFLIERGGHAINVVVSLGIAIAILNAVIAIIIQVARLLYASARDGSWPDAIGRPLERINLRFQTPIVATSVVGIAAVLAGAFVSFNFLLLATGAGLIVIYAVVAVSALIDRNKRAEQSNGYKMPWWPLPPIVVIAATVYVAYQGILADWRPILISIVTVAIGVVYYYIFIHPRRESRWTLPDALHDHSD